MAFTIGLLVSIQANSLMFSIFCTVGFFCILSIRIHNLLQKKLNFTQAAETLETALYVLICVTFVFLEQMTDMNNYLIIGYIQIIIVCFFFIVNIFTLGI
jgi:hypothetical protein